MQQTVQASYWGTLKKALVEQADVDIQSTSACFVSVVPVPYQKSGFFLKPSKVQLLLNATLQHDYFVKGFMPTPLLHLIELGNDSTKEGSVMDQEKVTIKINDNGSIRVNGVVELVDGAGDKYEVGSTFSLCRCGQSEKKPFCDGTHKQTGFESAPRAK